MYLCGLLSDQDRKNIESIAYRYDQDRQALQKFIGSAPWDHHQTLSLIALWFLILETGRGKKYTPALTVPQVRMILYVLLRQACDRQYPGWAKRTIKRKSKRRELARFYHYQRHKLLAPLRVKERK
jgi:hypothetical protein